MRVIKCDLCGKEIEEHEAGTKYQDDKKIDLCENCDEIYEKCETEIVSMRKELRIKYENEIEKETQKIFNKYGIGGKKNEEEGF